MKNFTVTLLVVLSCVVVGRSLHAQLRPEMEGRYPPGISELLRNGMRFDIAPSDSVAINELIAQDELRDIITARIRGTGWTVNNASNYFLFLSMKTSPLPDTSMESIAIMVTIGNDDPFDVPVGGSLGKTLTVRKHQKGLLAPTVGELVSRTLVRYRTDFILNNTFLRRQMEFIRYQGAGYGQLQ